MNRLRLLILTAALAIIGGISAAAVACTRHPPQPLPPPSRDQLSRRSLLFA